MRIIPLLIISVLFATASAQSFPALVGVTADDNQVNLPLPTPKDWTVIGIAASQQAAMTYEGWYEPAYQRFIAQYGLMAGAYECDVYFVLLFEEANKTAFEPTLKYFRDNADPEVAGHLLFSQQEADPLLKKLKITDKETPHFFIIDAKGNIVHRSNGAFTEDKLEALEDVMLEE
jgi:hypothetical protein